MNEPILEVRNLVKHYPHVTAVDGVSLAVPEGICFGLLGPNGAGKTTTIEIMEGILEATSGEVRYRGEPLDQRFKEEAGILFQKTALQDFLTVRQSITMFRGLYAHGLSVDEVIQLCALEKLESRDNRKLSGGQLQRLLLAIALVNDPTLLFLDEPTTGSRPAGAAQFLGAHPVHQGAEEDHHPDHALHGRSRAALRRDRHHGPGPDHRAGPAARACCSEHFDEVMLELPRQEFPDSARSLPLRIIEASDRVEITTDDLDGTLRTLMDAHVP